MIIPGIILCLMLCVLLCVLVMKLCAMQRADYIHRYVFPVGLFDKLRKHYPHLTPKDCQLVAQGLRHFFLAHLKSGRKFVAMPSQVADDLWHEFILNTRHYDVFCKAAFGRFMHHTPAVVLGSVRASNEGLRRCWWHTCREENINPHRPSRLPLLFALDAKLKIPNGFYYVADCQGFYRQTENGDAGGICPVHCGTDMTNTNFDGSTTGLGDHSSSGDFFSVSDSGSDSSSGDGGGSGCGGGGCGGGD